MKQTYLLIVLIFCSCAQNTKEKTPSKGAVEIISAVENVAKEVTEQINNGTTFKEELQKLKTKKVPLIDSTSFDSFIDESDYKTINAEAFQLPKIYKNWYEENDKHRAVSAYRLNLSDDFYTVVVTVLSGDEVMESKLINYDLEGNVIASEMIAYDETVESWARTKSTIESNKITIDYQYTVSEDDEDGPVYSVVKIESDGNFRVLGIRDICYELVIKELNLNESKLIPTLQVFKILPNSPNEAVVVIPEIAVGSEEEGYLEFNTHVALVNTASKEITHQYFESHQTNGWISDAIHLREITIDTAPYDLSEDVRAFGIRIRFIGSSQVNPYENEALSLFVKSGDNLKKVLNNFDIMKYGGEWNGDCDGEFLSEEKTLSISEEKTNGYFDIIIKNKLTKSINVKDELGNCDTKETFTNKTSVLKFDGKTYR